MIEFHQGWFLCYFNTSCFVGFCNARFFNFLASDFCIQNAAETPNINACLEFKTELNFIFVFILALKLIWNLLLFTSQTNTFLSLKSKLNLELNLFWLWIYFNICFVFFIFLAVT